MKKIALLVCTERAVFLFVLESAKNLILGMMSMILAESIYQQSLSLPENIASEVLDFIIFLKQRYAISTETVLTEEEKRQHALAHIANVKAQWHGKPIANRDSLYDDSRSLT